ncbi:MAG TPA: DNA polymerase III subunit delta [Verrucomicrobiales bacterium]|nr:DNA polymerase III subunit delta [Verrucomicrobiales bacterium]
MSGTKSGKLLLSPVLICGDDDFTVSRRSAQIFHSWLKEFDNPEQEVIEGQAGQVHEALRIISQVRQALNTFPFFSKFKVIWLKNCSFMGDDRVSASKEVGDQLKNLIQSIKDFDWTTVRFLISSGKTDKRKSFYTGLRKMGSVESYAGLSINDKDWLEKGASWVRGAIRRQDKEISVEALTALVSFVGPSPRELECELDKLVIYIGDRDGIELKDVEILATRNKHAKAFALADSFGDRKIPQFFKILDEELWEVKLDPKKSPIGLLYGLIGKVRTMIWVKEMVRLGWLKWDPNYASFKSQLSKVPEGSFPKDKRYNPLATNPFVLYRSALHARNFSIIELIEGMQLLLDCNLNLISSSTNRELILQQTLVKILEGSARN